MLDVPLNATDELFDSIDKVGVLRVHDTHAYADVHAHIHFCTGVCSSPLHLWCRYVGWWPCAEAEQDEELASRVEYVSGVRDCAVRLVQRACLPSHRH